jgi:hypothetical protein
MIILNPLYAVCFYLSPPISLSPELHTAIEAFDTHIYLMHDYSAQTDLNY